MLEPIKARHQHLMKQRESGLQEEPLPTILNDQAWLIAELERLQRSNADLREALLRQAGNKAASSDSSMVTAPSGRSGTVNKEMATRLKDALWE